MNTKSVATIYSMMLAFAGIAPHSAVAQSASIEGRWSGGGVAALKDGQREPVRCRVSYEKSTGRTFLINANCSHSNGTFQQSGRITQLSANSYSGRLYSDQYSVAGQLSISVSGSRQTLTATSDKGRATLTLTK